MIELMYQVLQHLNRKYGRFNGFDKNAVGSGPSSQVPALRIGSTSTHLASGVVRKPSLGDPEKQLHNP